MTTVADIQAALDELSANTAKLMEEEAADTPPAGSVVVQQSDLDTLAQKVAAANEHVLSLISPNTGPAPAATVTGAVPDAPQPAPIEAGTVAAPTSAQPASDAANPPSPTEAAPAAEAGPAAATS